MATSRALLDCSCSGADHPPARRLLRQQLDGRSLVAALLSERREAATAEER
ncbi:MAG: hypothetical protein ACR2K2_04845 [Mycobacteriales bacterium]